MNFVELPCECKDLVDAQGVVLWSIQVLDLACLDGLAFLRHYRLDKVDVNCLECRQIKTAINSKEATRKI